MFEIHRSEDRGLAEHGWLYSRHSFSFADYYNPKRMGFGLLRVINDDVVEPGEGFPMHAHDNMEIVSIVLAGALEHQDSKGNHGVIRPGDVQRMSAGSGIRHSEFNPSQTEKVHLLQIWLHPKERGIQPEYEQKTFSPSERQGRFQTLVSGKKNPNAVYFHQDAVFSLGSFEPGKSAVYTKEYPVNGVYAFLISGEMKTQNQILKAGDAAAFSGPASPEFQFIKSSELLILEVPLN